jgi:iron complex outermembrane receptor protein
MHSLTDEKGTFQISGIKSGKYILKISRVGYQTINSSVFELKDSLNKDFGLLLMKAESTQLGEVVIRSSIPLIQQESNGTIINVENNILTKGSSVLEVLERSPGVVVDRRNNVITLNGKSGAVVMLNGKPTRMSMEQVVTLLNSMSANGIQKVELLTTPPTSYDAEGSAGMINIVLKKNKAAGTNGNISMTGGFGWGEKATASTYLAHNLEKISIYGNYTYLHDKSYADWFSVATANEPLLGGQTNSEFLSTIKSLSNNHNATAGLELRPNSKTTVGANISYTNSSVDINTLNNATYVVLPDSLLKLNAEIISSNNWRNATTNIYMEQQVRKGEKFSLNADYLSYQNNRPTDIHSFFLNDIGTPVSSNDTLFSPRQKGFANTSIKVGVAKIDYSNQLTNDLKIEAGIKGTYTETSSLSGIQSIVAGDWVSGRGANNETSMNENIGAGYFSTTTQLSPSTNLIVGLRYEYSDTHMNDQRTGRSITSRKLGKLFPNMSLSIKISNQSEFQLAYSKRISRPSYNELASFVAYADPTSVETGNPFLLPTVSNTIKLGYSYLGYSVSALLSRDNNPIARNQTTTNDLADILILSPQNLTYQDNLTFQANLPWSPTRWWSMGYSFVGGWRKFKETFTTKPVEKTYFGYSMNFNQAFKMPKAIAIEVSGWYNGSSYEGTKKVDGFGAVSMGIKKEFKNNRGTVQLAITDLLKSVSITSYYGSLTREALNLKSRVTYNTESSRSPIIRLTYSKSFGSGSAQRSSDIRTSEEKNRIRK